MDAFVKLVPVLSTLMRLEGRRDAKKNMVVVKFDHYLCIYLFQKNLWTTSASFAWRGRRMLLSSTVIWVIRWVITRVALYLLKRLNECGFLSWINGPIHHLLWTQTNFPFSGVLLQVRAKVEASRETLPYMSETDSAHSKKCDSLTIVTSIS